MDGTTSRLTAGLEAR
jgi:hypothetical protein